LCLVVHRVVRSENPGNLF